jgi:ketosteroid isomerase-like protein
LSLDGARPPSVRRGRDASFAELTVRGEYRALVESYYTADALFMAPNARGVVGHAAIEAMLRAWPPVTAFVLNTEDVVVRGDLGYSCGTYSMTMTPPGAAPIQDEGKFLEIFRRQADGSWKVTRDTFNSDLAAAGSEATK